MPHLKKPPEILTKKLFAKLKSRRGASLIIALVFFLFCITLVAIILNATDINTHLLSNIRSGRQNYLTASSAAELIRAELLNLSCEITNTTGITHEEASCPVNTLGADEILGAEGTVSYHINFSSSGNLIYQYNRYPDNTATAYGDSNGLKAVLIDLCEEVFNTGMESSANVSISDSSGTFEEIYAEFTLSADYQLRAAVRYQNDENDFIILTFASSGLNHGVPAITKQHSFINSEDNTQTCQLTINRQTLSVTWTSCVMTKGGSVGYDETDY